MRNALAVVVLVCLSGIMAQAADNSGGLPPLMQRFPKQTLVYFECPDLSASRAAIENTAFGKIWAEPELQAFGQPMMERFTQLKNRLSDVLGVSLDAFAALGAKRFAAGLIVTDLEHAPSMRLIADCPDAPSAGAVGAALSALINGLAKRGNTLLAPAVMQGDTTVQPLGDGLNLSWRLRGPAIIVTLAKGGTPAESVAVTPGATLADVPCMTGARAAIDKGAVDIFLGNATGFWALLREEAGKNGEAAAAMPVLDALGLTGMESMAMGVAVTEPGFSTRVFLGVPERKGVFSLFQEASVSPEILAAVPANVNCMKAMRFAL